MPDDKIILTPKPPKGEDGYRYLSVRIKIELIDKFNDLAGKTGISRNELIRTFIEYGLNHYEIVEVSDEDK